MRPHRVTAVRRVATTLALAPFLLGCAQSGEPVQLLTGAQPFDQATCDKYFAVDWMVVDPQFGTAVIDSFFDKPIPVMWPPGYTGRRVGSEVVVLDRAANLVAETGHGYRIQGTYWPRLDDNGLESPRSWYACGFVEPSPTAGRTW